MSKKVWLTTKEAAAMTGFTQRQWRELCRVGYVPKKWRKKTQTMTNKVWNIHKKAVDRAVIFKAFKVRCK